MVNYINNSKNLEYLHIFVSFIDKSIYKKMFKIKLPICTLKYNSIIYSRTKVFFSPKVELKLN